LDLRALRHTYATWLAEAAIPLPVIDELVGHSGGRRDLGADGSLMAASTALKDRPAIDLNDSAAGDVALDASSAS
jgi:integrase